MKRQRSRLKERVSFPFSLKPFIFYLFPFVFYLIFSCSNPTESNKVTFSGTVTLEDTTDFSGVTVSFYAPVELDTALVRINEQYPNIGVHISQETEFDHREHEPLYTTTTDKNGKWKIEAEKGEYNIVAEKQGWGWKYQLQKEQTASVNVRLYPVQTLSGVLAEGGVFQSDHFYLLKGNVIFPDGFSYQFQRNTVLLADQNAKLSIYASVSCPDEGFVFFKGMNNTQSFWKGIELRKAGLQITNTAIYNAGSGISIKENQIGLNTVYIKQAKSTGLSATNVRDLSVKRALITGSIIGMDFYTLDSTTVIESNILAYQTDKGIVANEARPEIRNNYLYKNETAISCQFNSNARISHNQIDRSLSYGILLGGSDPVITYNNLNANVKNAIRIPPTGYAGASNPVINYNNFSNSTEYIYINGNAPNPNQYDINAQNNWWGVSTAADIAATITDKLDLPANDPGYNYTGKILFEPFSFNRIDNAGISQIFVHKN